MITDEQQKEISKILHKRTFRSYFDWVSHEFNRTEIEPTKLDRLAELVSKNYLEIVIEEYLDGYEDSSSYHKLTEMKTALANTLKGYIGVIRYGSFTLHDNTMFDKTEEDLEYIIEAFKKDIVEIYIPKRGAKNIFYPYL